MLKFYLKLQNINFLVLKTGLALTLLLVSAFLSSMPVRGDFNNIFGPIEIPNEVGFLKNKVGRAGLESLVSNIIRLIFLIAAIAVLFFFLYGGLKWIFSGGDKQQLDAAKNMITAAVIGFAIVALTYIIMRVIETFFGIEIVGPPAGPSGPTNPCPGDGINLGGHALCKMECEDVTPRLGDCIGTWCCLY